MQTKALAKMTKNVTGYHTRSNIKKAALVQPPKRLLYYYGHMFWWGGVVNLFWYVTVAVNQSDYSIDLLNCRIEVTHFNANL